MRILRRSEFMKLPAGTLFAKGTPTGNPHMFDTIHVKGENIANDFYARDLTWIDGNTSELTHERLAGMLRDGTSYPLDNSIMRDGCFEENDVFLVYEHDDLQQLVEVFLTALKITAMKPLSEQQSVELQKHAVTVEAGGTRVEIANFCHVEIVFPYQDIPGEDEPGELVIKCTHEGLIMDVWVTRGGDDCNLGTSSEMVGEIIERLVEDNA